MCPTIERSTKGVVMTSTAKECLIVCHRVPGRLRVKLWVPSRSRGSDERVEHLLNRTAFVKKAEIRKTTGSIILYYDKEKLGGPDNFMDLLVSELGIEWRNKGNPLKERTWIPSRNTFERRGGRSRGYLLWHLATSLGLSGFLAYAAARRFVLKSPLAQGPLSATGIIAAVGALPLLQRTWIEVRGRKRFGLFPFLTAACALALAMGEALTALEIIWVLAIGILLEEYVTERARRSIRESIQVTPEKVRILVEGREVEKAVTELMLGDMLVVRAGERVATDGIIQEGEALFDESHITGRSEPQVRGPRDWVYAGTTVLQGSVNISADRLGEDTYLSRILRMVEESLATQTDVEKRADILAARLLRIGTAVTIATYVLTRNLVRSFSVMLVMACPCATVLAASTAVAAAIATAGRIRILIKGGPYLESIDSIDCVCLDKTGTLTATVPSVVEVIPRMSRNDPARILAMAALAERGNEHPLARAVVEHARSKGIHLKDEPSCEVFVGRGVRAIVGSDTLMVGNREFMDASGISTSYFKGKARMHMEHGRTVLYVARNNKLQGIVVLANTIRPEAASVLEWLKRDGIAHLYLVSGDNEPVVKALATALGFDGYKASVLPEDKARFVEELEARGLRVLMVGDGVNDAPALSKATVGVAIGAGGSETAVATADIALVRSDLEDLVRLRMLSRRTIKTAEQNFWIATIVNIGGILLGVTGWLSPVMAGTLHIVHTLGIMLNSSRLIRWNPPGPRGSPRGAQTPGV
jgi:cation-transporting P-type ATPase C